MSQKNSKADMTLDEIISKVQGMTIDKTAQSIARSHKYDVVTVTWEDCARDKKSVWGPCISDMTLQVGDNRMPAIRKNNYTDLTWDIRLDTIPIVVGNEVKNKTKPQQNDINSNNDDGNINDNSNDNNADDNNDEIEEPPKKRQKLSYSNSNSNSNSSNSNSNSNDNSNYSDESKSEEKSSNDHTENGGLKTITLKEYLKNFNQYMTSKPNSDSQSKNKDQKINLLKKDESKDTHVIVSSQACFLPIEKGGETRFNVSLFNYESTKDNPGVLAIIATSKGTSSQIICGNGDEKLLFNDFGIKSDFLGQRLTDNRIEKGVKDLNAPMTIKEKQDNCILIIQIPLKQDEKKLQLSPMEEESYQREQQLYGRAYKCRRAPASLYEPQSDCSVSNDELDDEDVLESQLISFSSNVPMSKKRCARGLRGRRRLILDEACANEDDAEIPDDVNRFSCNRRKKTRRKRRASRCDNDGERGRDRDRDEDRHRDGKKNKNKEKTKSTENDSDGDSDSDVDDECNVEPAMVKVLPQIVPECICGLLLVKMDMNVYGKNEIKCNECKVELKSFFDAGNWWYCINQDKHYLHKNKYYLCYKCCDKKLSFDELKGLSVDKLVRDEKYPIRMTLQYYKSTDNGVINEKIMKQIVKQLETSKKHSSYVGSLVTQNDPKRPTEWTNSK